MTFFKRELPSSCIALDSQHGQQLFLRYINNQRRSTPIFFKLISCFQTQHEPAYCGLATLAMCLNSLGIDPQRQWKGVWRWFDESLLSCCVALQVVQVSGITAAQFRCLAICNGLKATLTRADGSAQFASAFRNAIENALMRESGVRLAVCYSRSVLGQTGSGHFSTVAAVDEEEDQVLILDTARFKYPPHWVSIDDLIRAMNTCDSMSNLKRGFFVLRADHESVEPPMAVRVQQWAEAMQAAKRVVEEKLASEASVDELIDALSLKRFGVLFDGLRDVVLASSELNDSGKTSCQSCSTHESSEIIEIESLLAAIKQSKHYQHIMEKKTKKADEQVCVLATLVWMMIEDKETENKQLQRELNRMKRLLEV